MAIQPKDPIIVPPKELDKLWINKVIITSPNVGGEAFAEVFLQPYNDSGDVGEIFVISWLNIMAQIQAGDEKLLAVYMALLAIVQDKVNPPPPEEEQEEGSEDPQPE